MIIQELPPITKPKIRTMVEEIDGRNGDIITNLGYSAYDKEMTIGLYGNYDIDEISSFFNSSGKVVFSNEPEKYYNYQILEQIDYERLLRYRKATVTLHVQPFKYSSVEMSKTYNITTETSVSIVNIGNYFARPIITITGAGTVNLSLNNVQLFVIDFGETSSTIAIDTNLLEAYNPSTNALMNRSVTGDYDNFKLNTGSNTISWSGTITSISFDNYSRWI